MVTPLIKGGQKDEAKYFHRRRMALRKRTTHVGHLAALLPGDVIARYYRKCGANVLYVSGTDSHGTPITTRARKENCKPIEIVEHYHTDFCYCFNKLQFSYDNYT